MSDLRIGAGAARFRGWEEAGASAPRKEVELSRDETVVGDVAAHRELKSSIRSEIVSALRHELHSYRLDVQNALTAATSRYAREIDKLSKAQCGSILSSSVKLFSVLAERLNIGAAVAGAILDAKLTAVGLDNVRHPQSVQDNVHRLQNVWAMFALALGRADVERMVTDDVVARVHDLVGGKDDWRRTVRDLAPTLLGLPPSPAHAVITDVITELHIRKDKYLMTLNRGHIHPDTIVVHRRKAAAEAAELIATIRDTLPANVRRAEVSR